MSRNVRNFRWNFTAWLVVVIFYFTTQPILADDTRCGTIRFIEQHQDNQKAQSMVAIKAASQTSCTADAYFNEVLEKKTSHFQIFYTLEGPHKTSTAFVDTLAKDAEQAWTLFVQKMNMRNPKGFSTTSYYQKNVDSGLYPIEVVDLDLAYTLTPAYGMACHGCYGTTIFSATDVDKSQFIIDNDFKYTPTYGGIHETFSKNGESCSYTAANQELRNTLYNYSYAEHWEKAIHITTFHELYHSVQIQYVNPFAISKFWFEASAAGMEEIGAPEVDDYFAYLPAMFNYMGTSLDKMSDYYGAGLFALYLYNHVDNQMDKLIWEGFSKDNSSTFNAQFSKVASSKGLSADSLFHDFSTRLSFAGSRSSFVDSTFWIDDDEPSWPNFSYAPTRTNSTFPTQFNEMSYGFYSNGTPELDNFIGSSSVVMYQGNRAIIKKISSSATIDSLWTEINSKTDSTAWIFSKFSESTSLPQNAADSTLRAYPVPWRQGNLCFTSLPTKETFIELRTRRGDLISREKYEGQTYCLDESRVKQLMAPGVYRFRAGARGKTKDFLVIY